MTGDKRYSLPALKQIAKDNNIKRTSFMNKPDILKLLIELGLVSADALAKPVQPVIEINPKYEFLRSIRNNPKKVIIKDCETGIETEYPSLFKASRAYCCSTKVFTDNNGKVWKGRYKIDVIDN